MPEVNPSKSGKWMVVLPLCIGILIIYAQLYTYFEKRNFIYTPPEFKDLRISEGQIHFNQVTRSLGGELLLKNQDFKTQVMASCNEPFAAGRNCGRHNYLNTGQSFRELTKGRHGKVWWYPDADIIQGDKFPSGRLYQLEVDGKIYYTYEERKAYYQERFNRSDLPTGIWVALIIFILAPLIKMYRDQRKS